MVSLDSASSAKIPSARRSRCTSSMASASCPSIAGLSFPALCSSLASCSCGVTTYLGNLALTTKRIEQRPRWSPTSLQNAFSLLHLEPTTQSLSSNELVGSFVKHTTQQKGRRNDTVPFCTCGGRWITVSSGRTMILKGRAGSTPIPLFTQSHVEPSL